MLRNILIIGLFFILFLAGCSEKKTSKAPAPKNIEQALPELKNFLFVGIIGNRAGLYKYSFANKKYSPFWAHDSESVVDFSYSGDMRSAFFLTADDYGIKGAFPFIQEARIYLFKRDPEISELIENIGSGIQVFMSWNSNNTFRVILNSFDNTIANYVNQHTLIYNTFGKVLLDEVKTYDLTKDGYPRPYGPENDYKSPGGRYSLAETGSGRGINFIYLINKVSRKKIFIDSTSQSLNQAAWSKDEKFLVFSTIESLPVNETPDKKNVGASGLYVYSLVRNKISEQWKGSGEKNFFIADNFLIFDDGLGSASSIKILNFKTKKMYDQISLKNGCGLKNIPGNATYGAQ